MSNEIKIEEQELVDYVVKCIQGGISHDEIKKQLQAVGWSEDEIDVAYALGLTQSGVPTPNKNSQKVFTKKSSTVEIVINFFSFILLGVFSISLGTLIYGIINYYFPDKLRNYYSGADPEIIHYSIAALIISFPLYYWAMRFWFGRFKKDEGKIEARLTKWITYLVLLVAAITIVSDLIVVIFNMLQGEITVRFFLKALTIFVIAGGVFGFYFLERKKIQYKKDIPAKIFLIFGWVTLAIVLFSIIFGFLASGSPKTERMRTFDNQRSNDLQSIASCVSRYAIDHKALPGSLDDLNSDSKYSYCADMSDPETGVAYEYKILNKSYQVGQVTKGDFELCGNFSLDSSSFNENNRGYRYNDSKWNKHSVGRNCDKETVVIENEKVSKPLN